MRMFYNFLIFTLALNLSAFLLPLFVALPMQSPLNYSPTNITEIFSIETFTYFTVVGAVTGIVALLLRQGTYALYAMAVWAIGTMLPIVRNFILAVPILLDAVMPLEMNPLYPAPNPISLVITAIMTFAGFFWFMELITQRNLT